MNPETVRQWFIKEEVKRFVLDKLQVQGFTMGEEPQGANNADTYKDFT